MSEELRDELLDLLARHRAIPFGPHVDVADRIMELPALAPLLAAQAAVERVEALAVAHESTAHRRRRLAVKWHDAGRWQLADAFRNLARQAETTAGRIRCALDGTP